MDTWIRKAVKTRFENKVTFIWSSFQTRFYNIQKIARTKVLNMQEPAKYVLYVKS